MNKFIALLCAAAITAGSGIAIALADDEVADTASEEVSEVVEAAESEDTEVIEETETAGEDEAVDTEDENEEAEADQTEEAAAEVTDSESTAEKEEVSAEASAEPEETAVPETEATEAPEETAAPETEETEAPVKETEDNKPAFETIEKTGINPFEDCQNEWFTDYVTFAYENGVVKGVDKTHFDPEGNVTIAQLAVMLYRVHSNKLNIVTEDAQWADEATDWALENDLMYDFAGSTFKGSDEITREDIVVALYNAYKINNDATATTSLDKFPDADKVSEYALDAMQWAVAEGIIKGVADTWIVPQGKVTRAETATIFNRYLQNVTFNDVKFDATATVIVADSIEEAEMANTVVETTAEESKDIAEAATTEDEASDETEAAEADEVSEETESAAEEAE